MIQVATENFSQEDFLGLGKKNKAKRQEKRAARKEKRAAKKEARKGKGILGKIGNRLGVGKQAKSIRKDFKTAKKQIKTTGSFTRGSVRGGTIRKNPSSSVKFGGIRNGKPAIKLPTPFRGGLPKNPITGGIKPITPPPPVRGATPVQRGGESGGAVPVTPDYSQESQITQGAEIMTQAQEQQANPQTEQGSQAQAQNADGTPKKPFNWKLWGGIGGGAVLIIVIILIVVFTKK